MSVRISRIKIHRAGPLNEDFDIVPGDLNRIFGHNESGKSFVVEALIQLLFRVGKQATVDWQLRARWPIHGYVQVTGLGEEPVTFEPRSQRKLEDLWDDAAGIPPDLSRLLVVNAGDTRLSRDAADNVGHKLLRDYLSGEALLDKIQEQISSTIDRTEITPGQITGDRRGPVGSWGDADKNFRDVENLLTKVQESIDLTRAHRLEKSKEKIERDMEQLERARRYKAHKLSEDISELQQKRNRLPTPDEVSGIDSQIKQFERDEHRVTEREQRLTALREKKALKAHINNIKDQYRAIPSKLTRVIRNPFGVISGATLLVTIILGLTGHPTEAGVSALLTGALYLAAIAYDKIPEELIRLQEDFKEVTGVELRSSASIETVLEDLRRKSDEADRLATEVSQERADLDTLEFDINQTLESWTGQIPNESNWRDLMNSLRAKRQDLDTQIEKLGGRLRQLGVPEEQLVEEDPNVNWDPKQFQELEVELQSCEDELQEIHESERDLKEQIKYATRTQSENWAELIEVLSETYENVKDEYVDQTSDVLAQKATLNVCNEYREREIQRITEGISRPEIVQPLRSLTGKYERVKYDPDVGVLVGTNEGRTYPLQNLSTGAREQVFLALRIGFASIAMEGQSGFLILDDAFQHSDWNRRGHLVEHVTKLVNAGWQVFYFAMDNHIRDLIDDAGSRVNTFKTFKTFDLL